jgi:FkbM family methyltransferase
MSVPLHRAVSAVKRAAKVVLPEKLPWRLQIRKYTSLEEPEISVAKHFCNPSEIALDIGANRGVYAVALSNHSRQVVAVEPNPILAARLRRFLPRSVRVLEFAASNEDGECEFFIPMQGESDIDTRGSVEQGANLGFSQRTVRVKKGRIDALPFNEGPVGLIKIDVEGHELNALQGLTGIIERSRPTIIVESEFRHHPESPQNVFDFLLGFGYSGYFIHRGRLRPISEFSVAQFQAESVWKDYSGEKSPDFINNFLFVHPSRDAALEGIRKIYPC